MSALASACKTKRTEIVKLLLERAATNNISTSEQTTDPTVNTDHHADGNHGNSDKGSDDESQELNSDKTGFKKSVPRSPKHDSNIKPQSSVHKETATSNKSRQNRPSESANEPDPDLSISNSKKLKTVHTGGFSTPFSSSKYATNFNAVVGSGIY